MVVLAMKMYVQGEARERALDGLSSLVADALDDLDVEWSLGVRNDGFPSVTIEGPDAVAARNVLAEAHGTITPQRSAGEVHIGTLQRWDDDGFVLDVGFGDEVRVPADELGLGPGTPAQIRERFGLVQHLPLRYVAGDPPRLADEERDRLYDWTRGTGRVNVNSATRSEVRATVNRAGHADDVITIERLGLLEQSIICRPGTDPPGLLAAIGDYLQAELLAVIP